jgi:hypothetical protein
MANIGDGRPVWTCVYCTQLTDHPRHQTAAAEPGEVTGDHHLDCGREHGCDDCAMRTEGAGDLRGADLVEHLVRNAG